MSLVKEIPVCLWSFTIRLRIIISILFGLYFHDLWSTIGNWSYWTNRYRRWCWRLQSISQSTFNISSQDTNSFKRVFIKIKIKLLSQFYLIFVIVKSLFCYSNFSCSSLHCVQFLAIGVCFLVESLPNRYFINSLLYCSLFNSFRCFLNLSLFWGFYSFNNSPVSQINDILLE